jgi:hypothetical protein
VLKFVSLLGSPSPFRVAVSSDATTATPSAEQKGKLSKKKKRQAEKEAKRRKKEEAREAKERAEREAHEVHFYSVCACV